MTIQKLVKLNTLTLWEENPRKIVKDQLKKLCARMLDDPDFLNKRPILVNDLNGKLLVYCGNQRVRAAKALGWKEIICDIELNIPIELMRKRAIIDNKGFGEWDFDMLANEWDVELLLECGFNALEIQSSNNLYTNEKPLKEKKPTLCENCGKRIN